MEGAPLSSPFHGGQEAVEQRRKVDFRRRRWALAHSQEDAEIVAGEEFMEISDDQWAVLEHRSLALNNQSKSSKLKFSSSISTILVLPDRRESGASRMPRREP